MSEKNVSLREHAAKGGKWTAVSAIAGVGLQMAQLVALGRLLDPSDFGLMAMMMVVIGLANAIADFGLGNFLVQADQLCQRGLNKLLLTVLVLSLALTGMAVFSADAVAVYFKQPQLSVLLPWLSIGIVFSTLSQLLLAFLQRSFAFKAIAIGEIISVAFALLVTIALAMAGHGIWALVFGQLAAGAARLFAFFPRFEMLRRELPIGLGGSLRKAGGFALFQTGERILNYVGWNLDKLILGRFVGDMGLGIYTVAYQLMIKPFSVLNPIFTRVALPLFSSIKNDDARLILGYLQTLRVIALLSFPVYLGISIAAPGIILLVMGQKWEESAPVLSVLSVLGMFFSIGNPIGTLILAKGKPQLALYLNLVSLLVYAVAFAIGAQFGVLGVAWAFLLAGGALLYPLEFVLRYLLVGMGVVQYLREMIHLFIAAGLPLLVHGIWCSSRSMSLAPQVSLMWGLVAVLFFFGYVWVIDRPLLTSISKLIFKGK